MEKISIIIPVYNESENLLLLHQALSKAMESVQQPWEVIYVNDGSLDDSGAKLDTLALSDPDHVGVLP
jgi:dolichol-phosphate mannosyltransferase